MANLQSENMNAVPSDERRIVVHPDYLIIDGRPRFIYGGDLNYCRMRRRWWRDRIRKLKAAGMNTIAFYCTWLCHEPRETEWNFSGDLDLAAFMDLIHAEGMFTIPRIGPFVHGEMRNGGLPQWLIDKLGDKARTNDPDYLRYAGGWYDRILAIIQPRLITRGGSAILIQLENEFGSAGSKGDDMHRGVEDADERGRHIMFFNGFLKKFNIDIPLIDINKPYPGKEKLPLVDTGGAYPSNCFGSDGEMGEVSLAWWKEHQRPRISIETAGGMFARFFDWPPYKHTNGFQGPIVKPEIIEAVMYSHLAEGYNGINFFVLNDSEYPDGTAERMLPQRIYNFQAPLTIAGNLRESYRMMKRFGWFLRSFEREIVLSQPQETWAEAISCGIPYPGVDAANGDFFEAYHKEGNGHTDENRRIPRRVRACGRVNKGLNLSESNFLIMLNARNHGTDWLRDIRVETSPHGIPCEVCQEYPKRIQMELAPQENKIMPFFVRLATGHFVEYSTASLLDRRPYGKGMQVILYSRSDATTESRCVLPGKCAVKSRNGSLIHWESPCTVSIIGVPGNDMEIVKFDSASPLRYVLMNRERAGEVWDIPSPFGPAIASSSLRFMDAQLENIQTRITLQTDESDFYCYILAPTRPELRGAFMNLQEEYDAEFGLYKATGSIDVPPPALIFRKRHQIGDLIWETTVSPDLLRPEFEDLCLRVRHDGSMAYAYLDDELISDHAFGRFLDWEIHLRDRLTRPGALRLVFQNAHDVQLTVKPVMEINAVINWQ